jgi:AcrR family transcriptional regulator
MQEQILQAKPSSTHRRIVHAAIRSYREVGHRKTTVADIARGASMSPANVYRFFPSRQAIDEAVVAELLEQVSTAATHAARSGSAALLRLGAALRTISQLHEDWLANDSKIHELIAAAARENWPITVSHADRIRGVVRSIIAAGQASGEFRPGRPLALACCLLEAMDAYLSPLRITAATTVRPSFDEMMGFWIPALCCAASAREIDLPLTLRKDGPAGPDRSQQPSPSAASNLHYKPQERR